MTTPLIHTAFVAGEITPGLYGHVDLAKFSVAATTARNFFVSYRGGLKSRAGTAYSLVSKTTWASGNQPRLITFQFGINQGYALELGASYMRFFFQGAPILEAAKTITGATQATPCVITSAGHGFSNGDWVFISGVVGMTQLNSRFFLVAGVAANTFQLVSLFTGTGINSTGYGAYVSGGTAARVYTLATPWAGTDVQFVKFTQSADTMSITHPSYVPYDLARVAANSWTLTAATFGSSIAAPGSIAAASSVNPSTATAPATLPCAYAYVVTAVDATGNESVASPIANVTDAVDMAITANSITVQWAAVSGALTYNIYRAPTSYNSDSGSSTNALPVPAGAIFSYVGTSFGLQFVDSNTIPDTTTSPPLHKNPFAPGAVLRIVLSAGGSGYTAATVITITTGTGAGFIGQPVIVGGVLVAIIIQNAGHNYLSSDTLVITDGGGGTGAAGTILAGPLTGVYPGTVAYYQQRRVYASTNISPDTFWTSRPGQYLNFDAAIPTNSADAITGTPWAQQVNGIQWMITEPGGLIMMTGNGAWQVSGGGSPLYGLQPLTPSNDLAVPQTFSGVSPVVPPLPINNDIVYVQAKGAAVRSMAYSYLTNNYSGVDQTVLSGHLFTGYTIHEWCWCEEPYKIIWAVRSDGVLLSQTYLKEQEVYGWARHDTQGRFISVTSVSEVSQSERQLSNTGANTPLTIVNALYTVVERFTLNGTFYFIERMDDRYWQTAEDPWCVDCGLSTQLTSPGGFISASVPTGSTILFSSNGSFTAGMVGQVVRAGGGICVVTSFIDVFGLRATWYLSPTQIVQGQTGNSVQFSSPTLWTVAPAVSTVGGLEHIAGETVYGLADGFPVGPLVVSAEGTVGVGGFASNIKLGLTFLPQAQTTYLEAGAPTVQGRRKDITAVTVRVELSQGVQVGVNQPDGATRSPIEIGPTWTGMQDDPAMDAEMYITPGGFTVRKLVTGDLRTPVLADWQIPGQIAIQQSSPLPINLLAVIPELLEGDLTETTYAPPRQGQQRREPRPPGDWMLSR